MKTLYEFYALVRIREEEITRNMNRGVFRNVWNHIYGNMAHYWTFFCLGILIAFLGWIIVFPINLNFGKHFLYILGAITILGILLKPKKPEETKNEAKETRMSYEMDPAEKVNFLKSIFE